MSLLRKLKRFAKLEPFGVAMCAAGNAFFIGIAADVYKNGVNSVDIALGAGGLCLLHYGVRKYNESKKLYDFTGNIIRGYENKFPPILFCYEKTNKAAELYSEENGLDDSYAKAYMSWTS